MATKISELSLIETLSLSDVLPVVDVSEEVTNKCTVAQILAIVNGGGSAPFDIGPATYPTTGVLANVGNFDGSLQRLLAYWDARYSVDRNILSVQSAVGAFDTLITLGSGSYGRVRIEGSEVYLGQFADQVTIAPAAAAGAWGAGGINLGSNVGMCIPAGSTNFGGGLNIMHWGTRTLAPSSNPATGLFVYVEAGQLVIHHPSGSKVRLPDVTGDVTVFSTSAELRALLSDETGTGAAVFAMNPALVGPTADFIGVGGGTVHTSALLRVAHSTNAVIIGAKDSGATDYAILSKSGASNVRLGHSTGWNTEVYGVATEILGSSNVTIRGGFGTPVVMASDGVTMFTALPIGGYSSGSLPFRLKRQAHTKNDATDLTLTASHYECPIQDVSGVPGAPFNFIPPNTEGSTFLVKNRTGNTMTVKRAGGTGVTIATGTQRWVFHDGSDYVYGSN